MHLIEWENGFTLCLSDGAECAGVQQLYLCGQVGHLSEDAVKFLPPLLRPFFSSCPLADEASTAETKAATPDPVVDPCQCSCKPGCEQCGLAQLDPSDFAVVRLPLSQSPLHCARIAQLVGGEDWIAVLAAGPHICC